MRIQEDPTLTTVFSSILSQQGITDPIQKIDVQGLHDEPGFHWSNPGLKVVSVTAGERNFSYVVKRLGRHAKREVLVYRFLSNYETFPIPRLFHDVYNDDTEEYWIVTEKCIGRPLARKEQFWEECGVLLSRIHAAFWGKIDALPSLFHLERPSHRRHTIVKDLREFFDSLSATEAATVEQITGPAALNDTRTALQRVNLERLPAVAPPMNCLIHKSFHPPEIMWRQTGEGYVPVGVDWETARVGAPQEDFGVVGQLLAKGEEDLFQVLLSTYLDELGGHGISLPREPFLAAVRGEAAQDQMKLAPWLVSQYIKRSDDESFAGWCDWAAQEIPRILEYVRRHVATGEVYQ